MTRKFFTHLRQQWMGALALFLVLTGGSAYALSGSNTVFTDDIVNEEVKNQDIGPNAVGSGKIADGNVLSSDIGAGQVTSVDVRNDDLTGTDINESSLNPSSFTVGRSAFENTDCDPDSSGDFVDCVGIQDLSLPRAGRVLLIAAGGQFSDAGGADGGCHLEVDDSTAGVPNNPLVQPGELAEDNTDSAATNGLAITAVTAVLPAGAHDFELSCMEMVEDMKIDDSTISAVMIGAG